jgi:ribosomal protein S20
VALDYPDSDNDVIHSNSQHARHDTSSVNHRNVSSSSRVRRPSRRYEEAIHDEDEEMYAAYKQHLIKAMQANFIRFRSPGPKRITELVLKTIPEIENWDTRTGYRYLLRNSALKAFDNMRADFMSGTREIAENVYKQIIM